MMINVYRIEGWYVQYFNGSRGTEERDFSGEVCLDEKSGFFKGEMSDENGKSIIYGFLDRKEKEIKFIKYYKRKWYFFYHGFKSSLGPYLIESPSMYKEYYRNYKLKNILYCGKWTNDEFEDPNQGDFFITKFEYLPKIKSPLGKINFESLTDKVLYFLDLTGGKNTERFLISGGISPVSHSKEHEEAEKQLIEILEIILEESGHFNGIISSKLSERIQNIKVALDKFKTDDFQNTIFLNDLAKMLDISDFTEDNLSEEIKISSDKFIEIVQKWRDFFLNKK